MAYSPGKDTVTWLLLLPFLRAAIGVTFAVSGVNKLLDMESFRNAIDKFGLISPRYTRIFAHLVVLGELVVSLLAFVGGKPLVFSFIISAFLLTIFSVALGVALLRGGDFTCGCFGAKEARVSSVHVGMNMGLLVCAVVGIHLASTYQNLDPPSMLQQAVSGFGGALFALVWMRLAGIERTGLGQ